MRRIKEPFCGLSHGVGVLLSIAALITLLVMAQGRLWHTIGFTIYGASLIALYLASALYHWIDASDRVTLWLQKFDHCAIYLLIAGSYTPVCLIAMRGVWGWSLLSAVWALAIFRHCLPPVLAPCARLAAHCGLCGDGLDGAAGFWPVAKRIIARRFILADCGRRGVFDWHFDFRH